MVFFSSLNSSFYLSRLIASRVCNDSKAFHKGRSHKTGSLNLGNSQRMETFLTESQEFSLLSSHTYKTSRFHGNSLRHSLSSCVFQLHSLLSVIRLPHFISLPISFTPHLLLSPTLFVLSSLLLSQIFLCLTPTIPF